MTYKEYECHKLDTKQQVFFYEQEFYVLSNFSSFQVFWQGIVFSTSEHAYHWEKFHAVPDVQRAILDSYSAHEAFQIAQRNSSKRDPNWDTVKGIKMRGILLAKVRQHPYVKQKLLETGDRGLVEDSWRDGVWGWGPDQKGQNLLGKLWMEIRADLKAGKI